MSSRRSGTRTPRKDFPSILALVLAGGTILFAFWFIFIDGSNEGPESPEDTASGPDGTATEGSDTESPPPVWDSDFMGPGGYYLHFPDDFSPGLASVDDMGISVLIAVDISGSMEEPPARGPDTPKYLQASRALTDIVDFLGTLAGSPSMEGMQLKVGIIGFWAQVEPIAPLTVMDSRGFDSLRAIVANPENFKPGGRTAIGKALESGAAILAGSGTILKSLIIISDGENTEGVDPALALAALNQNRNTASTPGMPVETRGILTTFVGFDVDTGIYSELADIGSRITSASDQDSLRQALQTVLAADITRLEAGASR